MFGGGLPIYVGGHFVGAVGVSGRMVNQDVMVVTAGVQAIGSMKPSRHGVEDEVFDGRSERMYI